MHEAHRPDIQLTCRRDHKGGYIQFDEIGRDDSPTVITIWSIGTGIAGSILIGALIYIVTEWCEQSHLMTSDYESARRGLMRTRWFKRVRAWVFIVPTLVLRGLHKLIGQVFGKRLGSKTRMAWTA